jgi:tyrosyl-tRNA synthetase
VRYLKFFTWLTQSEVAELEQVLAEHPERREAQQRLAREMTRTIHGETALARAEAAARALFGGDLAGLGAADVQDIFEDVPASTLPRSELEGAGLALLELLVRTGVATSRGDARRTVEGGGVYVNNVQAGDSARSVSLADSIEGQFVVLRKGRRNYHLVKLV